MDLNYKELLKKYMMHVIQCEGIDFVDFILRDESNPMFNSSERDALKAISEEARNAYY